MKIKNCELSEITPYADNLRQSDAGVDAVAASIREFGFRQPIVVDEQNVIIVGHTRYTAAQKLGLEKVIGSSHCPPGAYAARLALRQDQTRFGGSTNDFFRSH